MITKKAPSLREVLCRKSEKTGNSIYKSLAGLLFFANFKKSQWPHSS
jgi:hypothetical protein